MVSDYRFEREANVVHDAEELRELLARLHGEDSELPRRTEKVTIYDVAEALGATPESVAEALDQIHQEHHEARIATVLRELEEPLYRVERASPINTDPLGPGNPLYRLKSVQTLAAMNRKKVDLEDSPAKESKQASHYVGNGILIAMAIVLVVVLIKAIVIIAGSRV